MPSVKTGVDAAHVNAERPAISRLSAAPMIWPKAVRVRTVPMPSAMARLAPMTIRL